MYGAIDAAFFQMDAMRAAAGWICVQFSRLAITTLTQINLSYFAWSHTNFDFSLQILLPGPLQEPLWSEMWLLQRCRQFKINRNAIRVWCHSFVVRFTYITLIWNSTPATHKPSSKSTFQFFFLLFFLNRFIFVYR